jgi:uncharacterized protein
LFGRINPEACEVLFEEKYERLGEGGELMNKLAKLKKIIKEMRSVLVAYSGGVDSTFLLKVCHDVLEDKVLAVTADSATYPKTELAAAKRIARSLGVRHKVIRTAELSDNRFNANPANRCYFCKQELFTELKGLAREYSLRVVVDASNVSDKLDYRPGNQAKKELGIRSPLQEVGLDKFEIRSLSKRMDLPTWNKPSLACLASRVPYGVKITLEILRQIDNI